jgi:transcriptional regulator with XRE-family HTH domain
MTNSIATDGAGVIGPSKSPRTPHTFRLQVLMEEAKRLAMAERIKELRERSPLNQPQVAERLGIGLRGYQKLEERGTTKWERAQELASIFDVEPMWIWEGEEQPSAPYPFASTTERLSIAVEALEEKLEALRVELLAAVGEVRSDTEALLQRRELGEHGQAANGS